MRTELQALCERFIKEREEIRSAFRTELDNVLPVCADIFLIHQKSADAEKLKMCRAVIKKNTRAFSGFRGSMHTPAACLLACSDQPQEKMAQAVANYRSLKEHFRGNYQMILASLLMTELPDRVPADTIARRGKELYRLMKAEHPLLTGQEDSLFAVLLAFSEKSDRELTEEIELCFKRLSGTAGRDSLQTVSHILALSDKPAEEKCRRFLELLDSICAAGMRYGRGYELSALAALSLCDTEVVRLVSDIAQINEYLGRQKGYKGIFGVDKRTRLMHAVMLVSTLYTPAISDDAAALSAMLSIIIAEIITLMIIISCTTVTTAMIVSST